MIKIFKHVVVFIAGGSLKMGRKVGRVTHKNRHIWRNTLHYVNTGSPSVKTTDDTAWVCLLHVCKTCFFICETKRTTEHLKSSCGFVRVVAGLPHSLRDLRSVSATQCFWGGGWSCCLKIYLWICLEKVTLNIYSIFCKCGDKPVNTLLD